MPFPPKTIAIIRRVTAGAFFSTLLFYLLPYFNLDGLGLSGLMLSAGGLFGADFLNDFSMIGPVGGMIRFFIFMLFVAPVLLTAAAGGLLCAKTKKSRFMWTSAIGGVATFAYLAVFILYETILGASEGLLSGLMTLSFGFIANMVVTFLGGAASVALAILTPLEEETEEEAGRREPIPAVPVSAARAPAACESVAREPAACESVAREPAEREPIPDVSFVPAAPRIVGLCGMYKGANFPIAAGEELILGRDAALSNIILDDGADMVSRKHCVITFDGRYKMFRVTDFSRNGTYLEDGNRLRAGEITLLPRRSTVYLGSRQNGFMLN